MRYQRIGIYPWAHSRIVPAITEITRAIGAPGLAVSAYQARGVGLHKTGEAADFQAGRVYDTRYDSVEVHNRIAKYVLDNWNRLRVRYMAWNGYEYGGSWDDGTPTHRKRKQVTNYGGSDPWHKSHVHVDFLPGAITRANPGIAIGAGLPNTPKPPKPPTPTPTQKPTKPTKPTHPDLEDDMRLVKAPNDARVFATNGITKRYIRTPAELTALNKVFGGVVTLDRVALDAIPEDRTATIGTIASDVHKTKAAMGRTEPRLRDLVAASQTTLDVLAVVQTEVHDPDSKKTLRERTEQTNHAVGRAEKARLEAEAKETE